MKISITKKFVAFLAAGIASSRRAFLWISQCFFSLRGCKSLHYNGTTTAGTLVLTAAIILDLSGATYAQNTHFGGTLVGESKLGEFIVILKQLKLGSNTPDEVSKLLGNPSIKTRKAEIEEWNYNFIPKADTDLVEMEKIDREEVALNQRQENNERLLHGNSRITGKDGRPIESAMLNQSKLVEQMMENNRLRGQISDRRFKLTRASPVQVTCILKFGGSGKLASVRVEKLQRDTTDVLYVKGDTDDVQPLSAGEVLMPSRITPPASPSPGQIYFNSSSKHFYGWDGTSWLKLDAKP